MFKSTSQNSQIRTRRVALEARHNTGGIDADVFKPEVDAKPSLREELVLRKINLEQKGREIRDQMGVATSRRRNKQNGQIDDAGFRALSARLNSIRMEVAAIDTKLVGMRVDRRRQIELRQQREADVFVETARELLADPIFKELMRRTMERVENNPTIPRGGT